MTPPPQPPQPAWQPRSLPRARAKARTRPSRSPLRPNLSRRASLNTIAVSRPFCHQATATQACLTTPECPAPYPVLPPSSMAPPCSFPPGGRDQPRPSSTAWASAWETPRRAPSSSRHSSSPVVMASIPSAQVGWETKVNMMHQNRFPYSKLMHPLRWSWRRKPTAISECLKKSVVRISWNKKRWLLCTVCRCVDLCVFSAGYEELTAGPAGVDYSKGYNSSSQAQAKSAATGPGKGKRIKSHCFKYHNLM